MTTKHGTDETTKHVLISIHGIRSNAYTNKHWQNTLDEWLLNHTQAVAHEPYRYGYWAGIIPYVASFKLLNIFASFFCRSFERFVHRTRINYPNAQLHIICHSFGSWIAHETIPNLACPIESLHIVGGVVSAHIEKNLLDELLEQGMIKRIYVWSSKDDEIVRFSPPPFGHIGYWGIIDDDIPSDRIKPRKKPYPEFEIYNRPVRFAKNRLGHHSEYFGEFLYNEVVLDILVQGR